MKKGGKGRELSITARAKSRGIEKEGGRKKGRPRNSD